MCKVGASKVTVSGGDIYRVKKVMIVTEKNGQPGNAILLDNGAIWAVTKFPDQPYYLLQVFTDKKELIRFMISVR